MGLIEELTGLKIALDTSILIYFLESHPVYTPLVAPLFEAAERQEVQLVTSVITLLEVLVLPYRHGRQDLIAAYKDSLEQNDAMTLVPICAQVAEKAAQLRSRYSLRTPDALQVSAGIIQQADLFLTNDLRLKTIQEIPVKTLNDYLDTDH